MALNLRCALIGIDVHFLAGAEIELLAQHGVMLPSNMQGLTEEQVEDLKLKDEFADVCIPSGGFVTTPDPVGRRNGKGIINSALIICAV